MSNLNNLNLDVLTQVGTDGGAKDVPRRNHNKHPKTGKNSLTIEGDKGTIEITTTNPTVSDSDWDWYLDELLPEGVDRSKYMVDTTNSSPRISSWDTAVGDGEFARAYAYKANIVLRETFEERIHPLADLEEVLKKVKKARQRPVDTKGTSRTYFVQITDLQAGQADGDGAEGMVKRAIQLPEIVKANIARLKKAGRPCDSIFIPITGDLIEGVFGFYETQTFSVSLDFREQAKLVRRLLTEILLSLMETGLPIHVAAVSGNHGERRGATGKAFTTLGDNFDIEIIEQIADAFALYPGKFDQVTFSIPEKNRISLTVEVQGHTVGLIHGHQARFGAGVDGKITNFFNKQAGAKLPIGDSDILFVGHYHHLRFQHLVGDTLLIMGGALCADSEHFEQTMALVGAPVVAMGTITEKGVEEFQPHFFARA